MRTIAIAIGSVLWVTCASAQCAVLGQGNLSCGRRQKDRRSNTAIALQVWVLGYLTRAYYDGINRDLTAGTDTAGIFAWINNYCRANPLKNLVAAVEHLVDTLQKRKP
jgi:hypothetical protein